MPPLTTAIRPALKRIVFKRRLPREFGRLAMFVSPGSDWRFLLPQWRAHYDQLLYVAQRCITRDSHTWDLGANVGVLTFAAAALGGLGGSVCAVEADPSLASLLNRSRRLLPSDVGRRVRIVSAAIADRHAVLELVIPFNGSTRNHLSLCDGNDARGEYDRRHCVAITADWLLTQGPPPDFVKCDVEGAEALFLAGADTLLSNVRPTLYIEVSPANVACVTDVLRSHGYELYRCSRSRGLEPVAQCASNTLAIPNEKTHLART